MSNKEQLVFEYGTLSVEDGILIAVYRSDIKINLRIAEEMVNVRLNYMGECNYSVVADVRKIHSIDKDARDYFASEKGAKNISALAILVGNPLSKMVGNFFINFSRPLIPSKLFTNETDAKLWLKMRIQSIKR